jgi:hypothetical protein
MAVMLSALHTGRSLLPRKIFIFMFLVLIAIRSWEAPRLGEMKKNSFSSSGLELATFQLVAQCLNYYATSFPNFICGLKIKLMETLTSIQYYSSIVAKWNLMKRVNDKVETCHWNKVKYVIDQESR